MNKNMRIWIIGVCVALVIIIVAAAASMNRNSGSQEQTGTTSERPILIRVRRGQQFHERFRGYIHG